MLAMAQPVNDFRNGFFPHPAFSGDQDADVSRSNTYGFLQGAIQKWTDPDDAEALFDAFDIRH